jgi:hypothetical protein
MKYSISEDKQTILLDQAYAKIDKEESAIILHWYEDALKETLNALAASPPPVEHFLGDIALNPNATTDDLKNAFIQRVSVAAGGVVNSAVLAPNNISQYANVRGMFIQLGFDTVLKAMNIPVLADLYRIDDAKRPMMGNRDPMPPALFDQVQLFN